ncbi:helix-turn-helix domain-containing protein [Arcanobacterium phocae]|uniref:Helix-turn-helix domain-containing protein n=2 Tax=Arcanobacterium phocae TaxID=131112 RepID=A0A1H2LBW7_9ACTO|nr:helix-turn-helix domain-containing protein [Arcanobacterium phocae]SDU78419.1 Helix-turn-helix domain-containing protein [Arcanobacterium phocae]
MHKPVKATYSFEFKLQAVQRVLSGETRPAIAKDLGLSSPKILDKWLSTYRSRAKIKPKERPKKGPFRNWLRRSVKSFNSSVAWSI